MPDPDRTVRYNDDSSTPADTDRTVESTVPGRPGIDSSPESTDAGFDETIVQNSQIEHLTEQRAPTSLLGEFGRYTIQGKLGEGGMGAVYIARDTQLDREVALKVPKFSPDDQVSIDWFYREARAMATVHHPNLCPVYDVGVINSVHYMSMAYIEGRPLTDYVKSDKEIQARQVAAVVRKIAIALHEAHKAGIIHRDLKPDNIMINTRKEPVIMDFGLARREAANEAGLTKTGQIMGTPSYMAPEQVEGNNDLIGPRTDVFALGVIMYQMLCGELPFKGVVTLVLAKIISETPPSPSEIKADVDSELERICLKAKERNPDKRYQSAEEMAQDLRRYLSGSSSGDTMRRARKSSEAAAQEVSQTDQLANEYFDSPRSYRYEEEEYVPARRVRRSSPGRKTSRKSKKKRGRRKKSAAIDPVWLQIGGACLVCLIGTVLFFAFTGDDETPAPVPGAAPGSARDISGASVPTASTSSQASSGNSELDKLPGHYVRQPPENEWHYVDIEKDSNGNLIWKNAAGYHWSLTVNGNEVRSGPDCKYGQHELQLNRDESGEVASIVFTGQVWQRTQE